MKQVFALVLVMVFVATSGAFAADTDVKGACSTARENASDQAIFNRVGDWFATVGKSGEEKEALLEKRRAERAVKKKEKEARQEAKKAGKAVEGQKDAGKKALKKEKKKAQKEGKKMKNKLADMKGKMTKE